MSDTPRAIDLSIDVPGTPEEVWHAIATGPGISSWYVPHQVEERAGGAATASFGPGPEMQVEGRVAAWEPPHRVVFDKGENAGGLAFEWLVEARDGGWCVVRLVNTGFGDGGEWDDQYDALQEGWKLFLFNLRLHLEHFRGQQAASALATHVWPGDPQTAWAGLTGALGVPAALGVGDRLDLDGGDGARLAGTVVDVADHRLALLLDTPAPGTGLVTAEGHGPCCALSVWAYLYGDDRDTLAPDVYAAWERWLSVQTPTPHETPAR
ncbi:MAG TPA: SRPBCC domain-containing protein [Kineosporiaceae bacterium]